MTEGGEGPYMHLCAVLHTHAYGKTLQSPLWSKLILFHLDTRVCTVHPNRFLFVWLDGFVFFKTGFSVGNLAILELDT